MKPEFRLLTADEIDCRIAQVNEYGVSLLLYKDARCDQNILDEIVGPMNWQRKHTRDNANCIVSIWDEDKQQWIDKEDTGTESFTEAEKGLASDSFKRACFNWGIGRELYTAPQMFVKPESLKKHICFNDKNGNTKWTCKDYFRVNDIQYDGKKIVWVQIMNVSNGILLEFGKHQLRKGKEKQAKADAKKGNDTQNDINTIISAEKVKALTTKSENDGVPVERILTLYKIPDLASMTEKQHKNCIDNWEKIKEMQ